jgi:glycosyltransferase involved in cell wall biosynthesis
MKNISCVLTCYNEEKRVAKAVSDYVNAINAAETIDKFEMIIIDDGSKDGTGRVIKELAQKYSWVRPLYHQKNLGIGSAYKHGLTLCNYEYVMLGFGDAPNLAQDLRTFFASIGKADFLMTYVVNLNQIHPPGRYLLSRTFTFILNMLSRQKIKYYNGVAIYRCQDLKSLKIFSSRFAVHAEIAIKLLLHGKTYLEVGMRQNYRGEKSSALKPKSIYAVGKTLLHLGFFWLFPREREYVIKK